MGVELQIVEQAGEMRDGSFEASVEHIFGLLPGAILRGVPIQRLDTKILEIYGGVVGDVFHIFGMVKRTAVFSQGSRFCSIGVSFAIASADWEVLFGYIR